MTIAVNTRLLLPGRLDGIGWFTFETLRRITTQHPEHQFLFLFDRKPDPQYRFSDNVRLVRIGPPARHPVLWWLWFELSLPYILRKYKADLLLSPEGMLSLRTKVPTLEVIHDLNFEHAPDYLRPSHQRFMTHFSPRYAQRAQRIATVSEFSKRDIVATYGIDPGKVDVVYDGSHEGYHPLSPEEQVSVRQQYTGGAPYFIFIGTISKRKNLAGTMLAFERFKQEHPSEVKLLVVGHRFNWPEEMEQLYLSLAHRKDILFFGRAEAAQLAQLLGASLCLVYCSLFEGFGIPIVEAFQAEVPVITSTLTSMPEVSGDAALLVDPTDIQAIADAMQQLASSPTLCQELVAKGRARRDLFSWDRSANLLWQSLETLLQEHPLT